MPGVPIQNPHLDPAPFFYPGNDTAVLLVHGFTATPVEMRLVGQYLHERGYTVAGPRLPGHGTTVEEMNRYSLPDPGAGATAGATTPGEKAFAQDPTAAPRLSGPSRYDARRAGS